MTAPTNSDGATPAAVTPANPTPSTVPPVPPPPKAPPPGRRHASATPQTSKKPQPFDASAVIVVDNVSKAFGDVVAVSDVSFSVRAGVTALLGPNGAGKSTLFRVMCGLTPPSRGVVRVLGAEARHDRRVRGRIGLAPQQDGLFDRFDALRFVTLAAATQAVPDPEVAARRALGIVELDPDDSRPVSGFSKGMRQRVKLAAALVHDPEVLILDEPLTGLDPVQRRRMIELFHGLGDEGRCVLVSSHVLEEVARLGSQILVIAQGRLVASGDYRELREMMDDRPHRVRISVDRPRQVAAALVESGTVVGVSVSSDAIVVDTRDVDRLGREVAPLTQRLDARLTRVAPLDEDLESVFRYLVERR
ncbi:MAG: ABC transporter ATP-binding protein [Acidimicrobiaceae bacterium]|nr:ABC transporter ATP-binding protein [Acidimicrobiaceae bacterium]